MEKYKKKKSMCEHEIQGTGTPKFLLQVMYVVLARLHLASFVFSNLPFPVKYFKKYWFISSFLFLNNFM
jgi:hypothetical protein